LLAPPPPPGAAGVVSVGTGVVSVGTGVVSVGTGVVSVGTGVVSVGTGVVSVGTGVVSVGSGAGLEGHAPLPGFGSPTSPTITYWCPPVSNQRPFWISASFELREFHGVWLGLSFPLRLCPS
jgi:hypothetical protein